MHYLLLLPLMITPALAAQAYTGPCDVGVTCAEAWGVDYAMTNSYSGPLFQLALFANPRTTLDVGQNPTTRAVDMNTWSTFCGGVASNCAISRIYAQIHSHANDLVPSVYNAPQAACGAGGLTCAARLTVDGATGHPIIITAPSGTFGAEYALSGDAAAIGINGGRNNASVIYFGQPIGTTSFCCGVFGISHSHTGSNTIGTDFLIAVAYGGAGGPSWATNCATPTTYCVGAEEESANDLADYSSRNLGNVFAAIGFNSTTNSVYGWLNGTRMFTRSPPAAVICSGCTGLNPGTSVHLGAGGDLSQPAPAVAREMMISNTVLSTAEYNAVFANVRNRYPALKFPSPPAPSH